MEFIGISVGIIVAFVIYYLQKNKLKLEITTNVTTTEFNSNSTNTIIYENGSAEYSIDVIIKLENRDKLPIKLEAVLLNVNKKRSITLKDRKLKLPIIINPNSEVFEYSIPGLIIANNLSNANYKNEVSCRISFVDDHKNLYYSNKFKVDIPKWSKDKGHFMMAFI